MSSLKPASGGNLWKSACHYWQISNIAACCSYHYSFILHTTPWYGGIQIFFLVFSFFFLRQLSHFRLYFIYHRCNFKRAIMRMILFFFFFTVNGTNQFEHLCSYLSLPNNLTCLFQENSEILNALVERYASFLCLN